ncbi:hypothetical protein GCM10027053_25440 [Intrasporangium mesophilum]
MAIVVALGLTGCAGPGSDRAGGRALDKPLVLEIAQLGGVPDQVLAFATEVEKQSSGSARLHFAPDARQADLDGDVRTLEDVQSGKLSGVVVPVRSLDLVGVTSFQPLLAPFLVDSQALQSRIFSEHLPQEMARGMGGHGLVGLAILPGPLRKVLGVRKPFLAPADFRGAVLGIGNGGVALRTATALGATAKPALGGDRLDGLDAFEQQVGAIFGNGYGYEAKYVTANVNPWPRAVAVVINDKTYQSMTDAQRAILQRAALTALPAAAEASRTEDVADVDDLCKLGVAFPTASGQQLAALRRTVQPVYDEIARDPANARMLERLTTLKEAVGAAPDLRACSAPGPDGSGAQTPGPTADASGLPDGTYETVHTPADLRLCDGQPGGDALNPDGHPRTSYDSITLERGTLREFARLGSPSASAQMGWAGSYRLFRNVFEFHESDGSVFTATFTFDGKRLTLTPTGSWSCDSTVVWTLHPWTLATKP